VEEEEGVVLNAAWEDVGFNGSINMTSLLHWSLGASS